MTVTDKNEQPMGHQAHPDLQGQQSAQQTPAATVRPVPDPRIKSPVLAMLLSLMPGLGQVYIGYYRRGFIHILVVASVISFLAAVGEEHALTPLGGLFLAFFWLYNIVDAGRRASLYNSALHGEETIAPPADFTMPGSGGALVGGICLIGLGVILLTNTLFGIPLDWVENWWPVALFIPGVWLISHSFKERKSRQPKA